MRKDAPDVLTRCGRPRWGLRPAPHVTSGMLRSLLAGGTRRLETRPFAQARDVGPAVVVVVAHDVSVARERECIAGHDVGDPERVRDEVVGVGEGGFECVRAQARPRQAVLEHEGDDAAVRCDAAVIGEFDKRAREGGLCKPAPLPSERAVRRTRLGHQVRAAGCAERMLILVAAEV